ncbi:guanylate cyclase [Vibrio sp. S9_S30]|uniref:heme NO-binding domain-containing protein n=1 Tax=Vibrio sp. S9_S30 TaxID=2720226 RepID=UPI001680243E|nr:heme NO-binding domain-containing protein [Vibrio sp. S9_S30]MBD1558354.1 guanylate cyclase [Vibrio sp. S9_S30]
MKGLIFTEFLELVEQKFGLPTLDKILDIAGDDGVYTSVGSYSHLHLIELIMALSEETGVGTDELQEVFGRATFTKLFSTLTPEDVLNNSNSTFQFLRHVEDHIHLEVKKLYPDAQPPKFKFLSENQTELVIEYRSARCMGSVCKGLILGCADHFQENLSVKMKPMLEDASLVRFTLTLI